MNKVSRFTVTTIIIGVILILIAFPFLGFFKIYDLGNGYPLAGGAMRIENKCFGYSHVIPRSPDEPADFATRAYCIGYLRTTTHGIR